MKKEINSKSRRKWIRGGLAAFASVALLTTGFAVWLVGVQKTKVNGDVTVNVETAKNENIEFNAKLKDSDIRLSEPTTVNGTGDFVKTETIDDNKEDFDISFESFVIKVGKGVSGDYDCVKFSLTTTPSEDDGKTAGVEYVDNLAVKDELQTLAQAQGLETKRVANGTYFDLATTEIDLPTDTTADAATVLTRTEENSYITYTLPTGTTFGQGFFKWGTFFGGVSPCTFYNKVFANKKDQTIENADLVKTEFDDMYNKYNGKSICLHMELGKKSA